MGFDSLNPSLISPPLPPAPSPVASATTRCASSATSREPRAYTHARPCPPMPSSALHTEHMPGCRRTPANPSSPLPPPPPSPFSPFRLLPPAACSASPRPAGPPAPTTCSCATPRPARPGCSRASCPRPPRARTTARWARSLLPCFVLSPRCYTWTLSRLTLPSSPSLSVLPTLPAPPPVLVAGLPGRGPPRGRHVGLRRAPRGPARRQVGRGGGAWQPRCPS